MVFAIQAVAFVLGFVYASFFEWFVHRHIMHVKRYPLEDAFRGHTIVHHQLYRGDESFQTHEPGLAPSVLLRWYAPPAMVLVHLPILLLIQWATGLPIVWGAISAMALYYAGYEYTHYLMHVPQGHFIERFRWFQFIREHHRLHHKYMLRNLNVFVPLADLCFGTLITEEGWRSKASWRRRSLTGKDSR